MIKVSQLDRGREGEKELSAIQIGEVYQKVERVEKFLNLVHKTGSSWCALVCLSAGIAGQEGTYRFTG